MNLKCPSCKGRTLIEDGSPENFRCTSCGALTSAAMLGKAVSSKGATMAAIEAAAVREVKADAPEIARRVTEELLATIFNGGAR